MAASSPSKKPPGECTEPTMFLEKLYEVRASSRRLLLPKHCATQPAGLLANFRKDCKAPNTPPSWGRCNPWLIQEFLCVVRVL